MNAKEQIRAMLKKVYDDGEVNAMQIWKGYSSYTMRNGWHYQEFGRSETSYLGKSVAEAHEYIEDVKASREQA
jgi:hypothetical protein